MRPVLLVLLLVVGLASCGDDTDEGDPSGTGVAGQVLLGPTCPVETVDEPCDDVPAADIEVTVHEPAAEDPMTPGEVVAEATTDGDGRYRVDVEPGAYLVSATAGMSCDLVPVSVIDGEYAAADVSCDTGIR